MFETVSCINIRGIDRAYEDLMHICKLTMDILCELINVHGVAIPVEYPEILDALYQAAKSMHRLDKASDPVTFYFGLRDASDEYRNIYNWLSEIYEEILFSEDEEEALSKVSEEYPTDCLEGMSI